MVFITEQINFFIDIGKTFYSNYKVNNSAKFRLLDSFILFNAFLLIAQIAYMLTVGSFPKNSFLAGIICCIGSIVLTGK